MVRIAPLRGLLYNQTKIRDLSKVIAAPYDVITPEEQERLYRRSPHNIVRLILNRDPNRYENVARIYGQWQAEGIFVRAERPAIYFLRHRFTIGRGEEKERLGFIALARIEDFSVGTIRPHEITLEEPREDRFRIMLACHANLSPVFGLYSHPKQIISQTLIELVRGVPPLMEVSDHKDGVCLLWGISDPEVVHLVQRQMEERPLLIADGHHRYEAAMNYRDHLRSQRGQWNGREAFNYVMMYFANMTESGLVILPTHRLVREFPQIPFQKLDEALQRYFYLEPYPKTHEGQRWFLRALKSEGKKRHLIGASFKGDPRYLILRLKSKRTMQRLAKEMSGPLRELDVSTLHHLILEHVLGLTLEEQLKEDAIRYLHDEREALQAVHKGDYQAAFILNPPQVGEVLAVALRGEKMPQKSTYFYPKPLTGLVMNKIDPDEEIQDQASSWS
ncbi:MAG: DUF1015 domain-containing protein [Candidatus Binatia bacterium]